MLGKARQSDPRLHGFLREGQLVGVGPHRFQVVFAPAHTFHHQKASEPKNREAIARFLNEVVGAPCELAVVLEGAGTGGSPGAPAPARAKAVPADPAAAPPGPPADEGGAPGPRPPERRRAAPSKDWYEQGVRQSKAVQAVTEALEGEIVEIE
jgi:hypothetical protein